MNLKIFFTWWNSQTLGTLLKTIFFGKLVGIDELGNKYYKNKQDERWVVYADRVEASRITSNWFLWIHHTIDKIPTQNEKKYVWQKKHLENKTGSKYAHKPIKITKNAKIKKYETWK